MQSVIKLSCVKVAIRSIDLNLKSLVYEEVVSGPLADDTEIVDERHVRLTVLEHTFEVRFRDAPSTIQ